MIKLCLEIKISLKMRCFWRNLEREKKFGEGMFVSRKRAYEDIYEYFEFYNLKRTNTLHNIELEVFFFLFFLKERGKLIKKGGQRGK